MGQCPSTPHSLDEDDFTIATHPESAIWRQAKQLHTSIRKDGNTDMRKSFLKLHRPDRVQKCMIDPIEVQSELSRQADEILDQKGLVKDEAEIYRLIDSVSSDESSSRRSLGATSPVAEAASVITGFMSDFAPSETTTDTEATKQMGNTATSPGENQRNARTPRLTEQVDAYGNPDDEEDDILGTVRAPSGRRLRSEAPQAKGADLSSKRKAAIQKYVGVFTACVQPKDDLQIRREEYMSVLHLKLKANFGHYFSRRYFPMFPTAPAPQALRTMKSNGDLPSLVSHDSDSSSADSGESRVGFGAIPPSNLITSLVSGSVFMDLSVTGSLGLVPRHRHSSRKSRSGARRSDQKSPEHYIVLMNRRSGAPLAVCALKARDGLPIVRIYATKQRVAKQRSAATTDQLGLNWSSNLPLYAWAELVTESMHPNPDHFSVYMASGSEGRFAAQPSYLAFYESDSGAPLIKIVGRTDQEAQYSGSGLVSIETAGSIHDDDLYFHIDIAHGIDPALMICCTAIMDEVIEKSMRMRCKEQRQRRKHVRTQLL